MATANLSLFIACLITQTELFTFCCSIFFALCGFSILKFFLVLAFAFYYLQDFYYFKSRTWGKLPTFLLLSNHSLFLPLLLLASPSGSNASYYPFQVLERRIERTLVNFNKMEFGFMPGNKTVDAIFIVRRMQEEYQKKDKKLYMCFVDMEKSFCQKK